ncbi:hypothetical protein LCGC14_2729090, partial [marine sediment metagenome]
ITFELTGAARFVRSVQPMLFMGEVERFVRLVLHCSSIP